MNGWGLVSDNDRKASMRRIGPTVLSAANVNRSERNRVPSLDQWKESPQAQVLVALGLSMVKPCFSMVSMKSMVAPER